MLQFVALRYRDLPACTLDDLGSLLSLGTDLVQFLPIHYHFFLNFAFE